MKTFQFILVSCLISLGCADTVMDTLLDNWLSHVRNMMTATMNGQSSVKGLQFITDCGALMTWGNCTVVADEGFMSDLSSITRQSSLSFSQQNGDSRVGIIFDLAYRPLQLRYPNMIVSGLVNMQYKDVRITPTEVIPFTVNMDLDYSKGVDRCTNSFRVSPTSKLPKFSATVIQPTGVKSTLPINLIQPVITSFVKEITDHINSLILYENVCTKLANLF